MGTSGRPREPKMAIPHSIRTTRQWIRTGKLRLPRFLWRLDPFPPHVPVLLHRRCRLWWCLPYRSRHKPPQLACKLPGPRHRDSCCRIRSLRIHLCRRCTSILHLRTINPRINWILGCTRVSVFLGCAGIRSELCCGVCVERYKAFEAWDDFYRTAAIRTSGSRRRWRNRRM
ncbi:hypothetical protein BC829DRAFT_393838, partial [Chytridium lagenaria]